MCLGLPVWTCSAVGSWAWLGAAAPHASALAATIAHSHRITSQIVVRNIFANLPEVNAATLTLRHNVESCVISWLSDLTLSFDPVSEAKQILSYRCGEWALCAGVTTLTFQLSRSLFVIINRINGNCLTSRFKLVTMVTAWNDGSFWNEQRELRVV